MGCCLHFVGRVGRYRTVMFARMNIWIVQCQRCTHAAHWDALIRKVFCLRGWNEKRGRKSEGKKMGTGEEPMKWWVAEKSVHWFHTVNRALDDRIPSSCMSISYSWRSDCCWRWIARSLLRIPTCILHTVRRLRLRLVTSLSLHFSTNLLQHILYVICKVKNLQDSGVWFKSQL